MEKFELITILTEAKLLYGYQELSKMEIEAWNNYFGAENAVAFRRAMMAAVKSSKFFPSPEEIQSQLEIQTLPRFLTLTGEEALQEQDSDHPLIRDAMDFADIASPYDTRQYSSPEELDKANTIQKAVWRREFKLRFERKRDEIRMKIKQGLEIERAINETIYGQGPRQITNHEKKLLSNLKLISSKK